MQTAHQRTTLGFWCQSLCLSSRNVSQQNEQENQPPQLPKSRNKSLGITLTIKSKQDRSQKIKSVTPLKPRKHPQDNPSRKKFLEISKIRAINVSIQKAHKAKLSIEITTFVNDDCSGISPSPSCPMQQSSIYSQSSESKYLHYQSSSAIQCRLSSSKHSSNGSVLLVRNDEDDEKNQHLKIRSLFQSRRMNSANRISVSNMLNSISQETETHEMLALNTPKQNKILSFSKKKYGSELVSSNFQKSRDRIIASGHAKVSNGTNFSTANTTNVKSRHNSFGSVTANPSRKALLPPKPLRL